MSRTSQQQEKMQQFEQLFNKLGRSLRAAREERNIPLQEICDRTRIQLEFLKQIEAGRLEGLPEFVFVRGFVRNYAQALGLDYTSMQGDLQRISDLIQQLQPFKKDAQQGFSVERLYDIEPKQSLWPLVLVVSLLVVVGVWTLFVFIVPGDDNAALPPAAEITSEKDS